MAKVSVFSDGRAGAPGMRLMLTPSAQSMGCWGWVLAPLFWLTRRSSE